jgi:D-alanine-D-alanine ligase
VRIGLTYNLKTDISGFPGPFLPEDAAEELDHPETIEAIRSVLVHEGHEVFPLGGTIEVIEKIKEENIEFVFNIAEGFQGRSREAHIPALLELLGTPYSGSDPLALALTLDKALTKRIAISLSIPTPAFWVLNHRSDLQEIPDRFPLFVKPLCQGSSIGIRKSSRAMDRFQLENEVERLFKQYDRESILVEEYIPGRELTLGILGNEAPEVLGVMEIAFKDRTKNDFSYSLEVKRNWKDEVAYYCPAEIDLVIDQELKNAACRLFKTLGLRDLARFDFRVTPEGKFYFLEVNPLPGLSPESGDFVILSAKMGIPYPTLILRILQAAFSRYPQLAVFL